MTKKKKIKLDLKKVLAIYESILINCPKCGKQMTPLGDSCIDPYHYCWDCKISIPMKTDNTSIELMKVKP